ncbi:hypothetical protein, partial [Caballeronia glathei]|uniref:hypothetical protein n=1 Tax=Caballeronia glathei TaxID=60547 RepID=UPI0019D33123
PWFFYGFSHGSPLLLSDLTIAYAAGTRQRAQLAVPACSREWPAMYSGDEFLARALRDRRILSHR